MMESLRRSFKSDRQLVRVRLKEIRLNPYQPRSAFDDAAIEGLAESIRENGLISPIILRRLPQGGFGLIAGERRLRALRLLGAGWTDAVVMDADEAETRTGPKDQKSRPSGSTSHHRPFPSLCVRKRPVVSSAGPPVQPPNSSRSCGPGCAAKSASSTSTSFLKLSSETVLPGQSR